MNRSNFSNGMYFTYCDKPVKTKPKAFVERSKAGVYNLPNDEVVDYGPFSDYGPLSYSLNIGYVLSKSKNSKFGKNKKTIVLVILILIVVIAFGVSFAHRWSPPLNSTFDSIKMFTKFAYANVFNNKGVKNLTRSFLYL